VDDTHNSLVSLMKPVQDLSNAELLAEVDEHKLNYEEMLIKESRRFELGKELARRLKEKTIKLG
jgi:hypothetical protein